MTLTLRIENFDTLEDGGPTWIILECRGASVGRKRGMDWVLPDPAKHISGHHFDISWHAGGYYLTDVSTNGTFVEGMRHRLEGPHLLRGGERLIVGHYIISVMITAPAVVAPFHGAASQAPPSDAWSAAHPAQEATDDGADPWDFGGVVAPRPTAPAAVAAPEQKPGVRHLDDAVGGFMPLQTPGAAPLTATPQGLQTPGQPQPGRPVTIPPPFPGPSMPKGALQVPMSGAPAPVPQVGPPPAFAPVARPLPEASAFGAPSTGDPFAVSPSAPAAAPVAFAAPTAADFPDAAAFVRAFCDGAGLPPPAAPGTADAAALAHALGQSMRAITDEVMRMLNDRASVKHFTKGGERTMRSATGNNPMKFLPDPAQALDAMFLRHRDGFMAGPEGFDNAMKDLRYHQMAVFAALQPALAAVLDGLSPEEIEAAAEKTGNLLGGSRKAKAWEMYVRRWDDKADRGEHGMLDIFLAAFARAYAEVNARSGD